MKWMKIQRAREEGFEDGKMVGGKERDDKDLNLVSLFLAVLPVW